MCAVHRSDPPGKDWYAQLLLLFSCNTKQGHGVEFAFVRWLTDPLENSPRRAENMKLTELQWAMTSVEGIRAQVFHTDVVRLSSILGPCYIQPDPVDKRVLYCNHWIGNISNDNCASR